jgi:predicted transcriptional regulator
MTSTADMISVNIPKDMAASLDLIAGGLEIGRDALVAKLLKAYLTTEGAEVLDILEAQREVANGLTVDFDEVLAQADAIAKGAAV